MSDWEAFGFGVANHVAVHVLRELTGTPLAFNGGLEADMLLHAPMLLCDTVAIAHKMLSSSGRLHLRAPGCSLWRIDMLQPARIPAEVSHLTSG